MARVLFEGQSYEADGQSVLDCLTARGHAVPHSCRSGICQSCLMRAVKGKVPATAQAGLKPSLVERNFFLACQCIPAHDLEVQLGDEALERFQMRMSSMQRLNDDVLAIGIEAPASFDYHPGQYVRVFKDPVTARNYSLASVPGLDEGLVLHVRRVRGGEVSGWIFESLEPGDPLMLSEARGDCYYLPGRPEQDILLIGTGCGLAPLYAIARDALKHDHRGRIHLYHGARRASGLYLTHALSQLAARHRAFRYRPCISEGSSPEGHELGAAADVALKECPDLSGWRVYLCGNSQMVEAARVGAFLAGAASAEIFADPFLPSGAGQAPGSGA